MSAIPDAFAPDGEKATAGDGIAPNGHRPKWGGTL